jgi:hypothetical protein
MREMKSISRTALTSRLIEVKKEIPMLFDSPANTKIEHIAWLQSNIPANAGDPQCNNGEHHGTIGIDLPKPFETHKRRRCIGCGRTYAVIGLNENAFPIMIPEIAL